MKLIEAFFYPESRYGVKPLTIVAENVTRFNPNDDQSTYVLSGSEGTTINIPYPEFKRLMGDE